jgi:hypothetical protein
MRGAALLLVLRVPVAAPLRRDLRLVDARRRAIRSFPSGTSTDWSPCSKALTPCVVVGRIVAGLSSA